MMSIFSQIGDQIKHFTKIQHLIQLVMGAPSYLFMKYDVFRQNAEFF